MNSVIKVNGLSGGSQRDPVPVKIVSVDMEFMDVFQLVFRVVLSLAIIGVSLGIIYAVIIALVT